MTRAEAAAALRRILRARTIDDLLRGKPEEREKVLTLLEEGSDAESAHAALIERVAAQEGVTCRYLEDRMKVFAASIAEIRHQDLFRLLGVAPGASVEEVHRRWRELAKRLHPDAGGDAARFRRMREAYETLTDPGRRVTYDAFWAARIAPIEHVGVTRRWHGPLSSRGKQALWSFAAAAVIAGMAVATLVRRPAEKVSRPAVVTAVTRDEAREAPGGGETVMRQPRALPEVEKVVVARAERPAASREFRRPEEGGAKAQGSAEENQRKRQAPSVKPGRPAGARSPSRKAAVPGRSPAATKVGPTRTRAVPAEVQHKHLRSRPPQRRHAKAAVASVQSERAAVRRVAPPPRSSATSHLPPRSATSRPPGRAKEPAPGGAARSGREAPAARAHTTGRTGAVPGSRRLDPSLVLTFIDDFRRRYEGRRLNDLVALFAPEAVENGRWGRVAIAKAYRDTFERFPVIDYRLEAPLVHAEADRAVVRAAFSIGYIDRGGKAGVLHGRAWWQIERRIDGLKIVRLDYTVGKH